MATIAVGDTLAIKLGSYCSGQAGINVLHYDCTSIMGTSSDLQDAADDFDGFVEAAMKDLLATNATWYGVQVQRIRPGNPSTAFVDSSNVGPGQPINLEALPTQTSGVITWQSDFAGRSNRGRSFIPFPGRNDHDLITERPKDSYVTRLNALATILFSPITVGDAVNNATLNLRIYDRVTGGRVAVTGFRSNQKWGTQRRRGNYGAANVYPPF